MAQSGMNPQSRIKDFCQPSSALNAAYGDGKALIRHGFAVSPSPRGRLWRCMSWQIQGKLERR